MSSRKIISVKAKRTKVFFFLSNEVYSCYTNGPRCPPAKWSCVGLILKRLAEVYVDVLKRGTALDSSICMLLIR
jgi:hypothetical protein